MVYGARSGTGSMHVALAGVLFDKDGTLIDFQRTWGPATYAVMHAMSAGDLETMRRQADALHLSLDDRRFRQTSPFIAGSTSTYGEIWARALGRDDIAAVTALVDDLTKHESLKSMTPIGDPKIVLGALQTSGLRLGVGTNDSEASARRQVAALGLEALIEFVAGYDSGHGSKPKPGMVLAFARHLEVAPHRVAMVGDTMHDLDAARAAGAMAVAVLSGPASPDEISRHADYVVEDISHLPELFAKL